MDDDREKKPSLTSKHTRAPFLLSSPPPLLWFPFSFKNGKFFFFLFRSFEGARRDDDDHKPSSPPPNTTKHTTAKKKRRRGSHSCFFNFLILSLLSFSKWRIGSVSFYEEQSGGKGGGGTGRARAWAEHTNTHFLFSSLAAALVQKWKKEKGNENS